MTRSKQRVLVTGARGQLGAALQRSAPPDVEIVALDHAQLDIADGKAVHEAVARARPALIVNAAAYTAVDNAEREREKAFAVNAAAPGFLAEASIAHGARLIHVSTDYVFDGAKATPYAPGDAAGPVNVYGESKLAGERAVMQASAGRALIVRSAWIYASEGRNFLNTMRRLLHQRPEVRVVDDQFGAPTHAASLARALWRWADKPEARGLRHWTDAGVTSWFGFASAIRNALARAEPEARLATVVPIPTSEYPTPAPRPARAVLDCSGSYLEIGAAAAWDTELRQCLAEQLRRPNP